MRIYKDIEQGSLEWHQLRAGVITASDCSDLLMGKDTKGYVSYIDNKGAERLTGFVNDEIQYKIKQVEAGKEREPDARQYYSIAFKCEVEEIGFIKPEQYDFLGASPDGLIKGVDKGIELKCPTMGNHFCHLRIKSQEQFKKLRKDWYWQIQMCLLVSGYESWDFVSYHPFFTGRERMVAIEIKPDENDQILLKKEIFAANELIEKYINEIKL